MTQYCSCLRSNMYNSEKSSSSVESYIWLQLERRSVLSKSDFEYINLQNEQAEQTRCPKIYKEWFMVCVESGVPLFNILQRTIGIVIALYNRVALINGGAPCKQTTIGLGFLHLRPFNGRHQHISITHNTRQKIAW